MSKEQTNFIKGIGILLIMIHNYVDILLDIKSNEMIYSQDFTDAFLSHVFTANSIWYIFSFVGWIGVPLFFFTSGYGLTKKYNDKPLNTRSYILNHLIKLWILLVPIYLFYYCIYTTNIQSAIAQVTFTINFFIGIIKGFVIDPGAYWFFGAILQFYILFIFLRKLDSRWLWVLCVVFIAIHYYAFFGASYEITRWIRINCLGWGVPFLLGIIAARSEIKLSAGTNRLLCVASFFALCACMVIKWLAPFSEVCMIVFIVTLSRMMTPQWICFIGIISPSIFALHPLIRMLFYSIYFEPKQVLILTIIYIIVVLTCSWIHHRLLKYTDRFKLTAKR